MMENGGRTGIIFRQDLRVLSSLSGVRHTGSAAEAMESHS